jgi:hypothetical protein
LKTIEYLQYNYLKKLLKIERFKKFKYINIKNIKKLKYINIMKKKKLYVNKYIRLRRNLKFKRLIIKYNKRKIF